MGQPSNRSPQMNGGFAIALGVAIGAGLGVTIDNIALGVAIGIPIALVFFVGLNRGWK